MRMRRTQVKLMGIAALQRERVGRPGIHLSQRPSHRHCGKIIGIAGTNGSEEAVVCGEIHLAMIGVRKSLRVTRTSGRISLLVAIRRIGWGGATLLA